ncbi:ATP-binding protein [Polyangium sp. y55x31]|uniref:ATP-binding protein n=1 Tax=Polyangium sp. y55x31 TaxID=3042688 RepID=UPI002482DB8B|nr:ATP-binding protein [Polyangium sp. y55x31]MDI1478916.1 ATP-binding protein [Polyangium sp. y55x31]
MLTENARDLEQELDWLARVLDARLKSYFGREPAGGPIPEKVPAPSLDASRSPYAEFVRQNQIGPELRLVLLLALVPHVRPQLLDVLWVRNEATQRGFTEFGGVHATTHGGFLPTGETAVFLLAGEDLASRFRVMRFFDGEGVLARTDVVRLETSGGSAEPELSGALSMSREFVQRFTSGAARSPSFGADFPARLLRTGLAWRDLVLPASTLAELEEIKAWFEYGHVLLHDWGMHSKLRPGFTCLFHGPPGTGKTLAACLLGKHCNSEVYRVDLASIVSKYVGETEKNLSRVFDLAEHRRWILFFDEADALFGKRTRVDDAHDRYANQEVSFLLQRIEDFDGVVILASNMKTNIDDAFARRFQAVVQFSMPRPHERLRLWREAFSSKATLDPRIDLRRLADRFEVSGGVIMNVVRHASLMALRRGGGTILEEDLEEGIRRELLKEGRTLSTVS